MSWITAALTINQDLWSCRAADQIKGSNSAPARRGQSDLGPDLPWRVRLRLEWFHQDQFGCGELDGEEPAGWEGPTLGREPLLLVSDRSSFGRAVLNLTELNLVCRKRLPPLFLVCHASMLQTVKQIQILAKRQREQTQNVVFKNKGFYYYRRKKKKIFP